MSTVLSQPFSVTSTLPMLTVRELEQFAEIAYRETGIRITAQKLELMNNRLSRRLRQLGLDSYREYFDWVNENKDEEMTRFIQLITTNETYFFRCPKHFFLLSKQILPDWNASEIVVWSSACSTGEEPYSLAILLKERLPQAERRAIRIFASDIDEGVLKRAHQGVYSSYAMRLVRPEHKKQYFVELPDGDFRIRPELRQMVKLGKHNLKQPFPHGNVDILFCRNVLIYFDERSKQKVYHNLINSLNPGGVLFLGESEIIPELPGLTRLEANVARKTSSIGPPKALQQLTSMSRKTPEVSGLQALEEWEEGGKHIVRVSIGDAKVASNGHILYTVLGSCIAVMLYDSQKKIGGMVHIMLGYSDGRKDGVDKYADTGIPHLIEMMRQKGASKDRLTSAKIAGGAQMFQMGSDILNVSRDNIKAVQEILNKLSLQVIATDCGGTAGRRVSFDTQNGKVSIQMQGRQDLVL